MMLRGFEMRLVLRNGFAHPNETFASDDDLDALVDAAEKRSVLVMGVRCVCMVAGVLTVEFHDAHNASAAAELTGWPQCDDRVLQPKLKPRDGVHPAVVSKGYAYGDMELGEEAA
jgi:hypothetical protein